MRQKEILKLLADGDCHKEVAARLGVAHSTIKNTLSNMVERLEARSVMEVLATALRRGWIV